MGLKEIRSFAISLCQDQISISELERQVGFEAFPAAFRMWLQTKQHQLRSLQETPGRRVVRQVGAALAEDMNLALSAGHAAAAELMACECVVLAQPKITPIGSCSENAPNT